MLSFNTGLNTTAATQAAMTGITAELQKQQALLRENERIASRVSEKIPGLGNGLSTLGIRRTALTGTPSVNQTFSTQEMREFHEKMFKENVEKLRARSAAEMRGVSARTLARSPREIIDILQGGFSNRSIHGLAEAGAFGAEQAGLSGLAKMFSGIAGGAVAAVAGLAPTLAIVEVANQIMESAKQSAAATTGRAAKQSFKTAFEHSPLKSWFQGESITDLTPTDDQGWFGSGIHFGISGSSKNAQQLRMQRLGEIMSRSLRVRGANAVNWHTIIPGSDFGSFDAPLMRGIEIENRITKELSDNIVAFDKDKNGRAFLAATFKNKAFVDPLEDVQDVVESMLENGDNALEVAMKFRQAKGALDAHKKEQERADYELSRSPQALTFFRNSEGMKRALEERLIEEHQQWNDE